MNKEQAKWRIRAAEMEDQIVTTMKQKHLKKISVVQYMKDQELTRPQQFCLLGALKNFTKLQRFYVKNAEKCHLLLLFP